MLLTPLSPRLERSTRELNNDAIASNQQLFLVFFITYLDSPPYLVDSLIARFCIPLITSARATKLDSHFC